MRTERRNQVCNLEPDSASSEVQEGMSTSFNISVFVGAHISNLGHTLTLEQGHTMDVHEQEDPSLGITHTADVEVF